MRIAIIVSGLPRFFKSSYPYLKKLLLDKYNCDIFAHIWDFSRWEEPPGKSSFVRYSNEGTIEEYKELYNFKNSIIHTYNEEWDNYFNDLLIKLGGEIRSDCYIKRYLSMLFGIQKSFQSVENINEYDIVVRTRSDLIFLGEIPPELIENRVNCVDRYGSSNGCGDCFAFGTVEFMKHYANLFDKCEEYYKVMETVNTELWLPYHLREQNYSKIDTKIDVIRPKDW